MKTGKTVAGEREGADVVDAVSVLAGSSVARQRYVANSSCESGAGRIGTGAVERAASAGIRAETAVTRIRAARDDRFTGGALVVDRAGATECGRVHVGAGSAI